MLQIAKSLKVNTTLKELKLGNQRDVTSTGSDAEQLFADSLVKNTV